MSANADFGMVGLGVMGAALVKNLASRGLRVAVWDRNEPKRALAKKTAGVEAYADHAALVRALARPRRLQLMVPAGQPVDDMLLILEPLLEPGDIVVDGGNSAFADTRRREAAWRAKGLCFVGMGVSGGEEGALTGPSMMPGGAKEAWVALQPILEAIAARTPAGPCVTHVGADGAGHFVKTVHNGIEYADMQLLAEAWDLMSRGLGLDAAAGAKRFAAWNAGRLDSYLVEITAKILTVQDPKTNQPLVSLVLDRAGQKGTGRWTVTTAVDLGVSTPTIAAALDARVLSSMKDLRVEAGQLLPAPEAIAKPDAEECLADLECALFAGKVLSYAQGFELIRSAALEYDWTIDRAELARIWMGGCIIRAALLTRVRESFTQEPDLRHLAFAANLKSELSAAIPGLRRTVTRAIAAGLPTPALGATLAYWDALRSPDLPQNLIQAQRDAFGAHTYVRTDDPSGSAVHTDWLG